MCSLKSVITFCLFTSVMTARKALETQSIGFPESEEDPALANKDDRRPVYMPATCPVGELYYPGDQKDDWICDCRPGFVYHPKTDQCWPAYRKGPCDTGYYLVLGEVSAIPFCEQNPCLLDGLVMFDGKCELLGTVGPCKSVWPDFKMLTVNSTTLYVDCEKLNFESRFPDTSPNYLQNVKCLTGGKRSISGKCNHSAVTTT